MYDCIYNFHDFFAEQNRIIFLSQATKIKIVNTSRTLTFLKSDIYNVNKNELRHSNVA